MPSPFWMILGGTVAVVAGDGLFQQVGHGYASLFFGRQAIASGSVACCPNPPRLHV
jgi:hypothetical protein